MAAPPDALTLRACLVALSLGAGVLHASVVNEHADEWFAAGVFFVVVALFQGVWAGLALDRPSRTLFAAGAGVNAALVLLWVLSRTLGLPLGPEAGVAEPAGLTDALATAFEILLVVGAVLLLRGSARRLLPAAGAWVAVLAVAGLSAAALLAAGPGGH